RNEETDDEEVETRGTSHNLHIRADGFNPSKTQMAHEGRLCRSLQLSFVLPVLLQQARRIPALRVQHGGESPGGALRKTTPHRTQVLAYRRSGRRMGDEQERQVGGSVVRSIHH